VSPHPYKILYTYTYILLNTHLCPTTLSNINGIINLVWAESNTALFPVTVNVYLYKNTFSNALTSLDTGKTELYNSSFTFTNGGTITNTFPISITGANLSQTDIVFVTFTTNKASEAQIFHIDIHLLFHKIK